MTGRRVFALKGDASRELITYNGKILIHDNKAELEFLFPKMTVVEIPLNDHLQTMSIKDHPDMDNVRWPLDRQDFINLNGQRWQHQ